MSKYFFLNKESGEIAATKKKGGWTFFSFWRAVTRKSPPPPKKKIGKNWKKLGKIRLLLSSRFAPPFPVHSIFNKVFCRLIL